MAANSVATALSGQEMSDYSRSATDQNRWAYTWGVFKSNFGKIFLCNLFTLIFFLPMIAAVYIRNLYVGGQLTLYPFGANLGFVGVPSTPNVTGLAEQLFMSADMMFYALAVLCGLIAAVGVAGASYSLKKLVNTGSTFTIKGYFEGVRKCYFRVAFPMALFLIVFFCNVLVWDWKEYVIATGGSSAWPIAATVLMIILAVIVGILCMWFIAVGVSYKVGPLNVIKYGIKFLFSSILQSLIMLGIAFIPVWLLLIGGIGTVLAVVFFIICGFSFVFLTWMSFTQSIFDLFIAPTTEVQKAAPRNKTKEELAAEKEEEEKLTVGAIIAAGRSELVGTPVPPISGEALPHLGKMFGRSAVAEVASARAEMEKYVADYSAEHLKDKKYAEYNKMFAEREKAIKDTGKKGKKKKISADNLLR